MVLRRTIDLIDYLEQYRREHNLPEVAYEVGTEETNGGLTSTDKYEEFISQLQPELEKRGCPMPTFIVGQTGTLTRWTEQVGHYNFKNARELADMAKRYGVGLQEYNADYLGDATLLAPMLVKAIKTERWRKWMTGDDVNLQVDDILADDELSLKILDVSGHYAFNDPEVKEQVEKLYRNLAVQDIDGKRFVIDHSSRPIK